MTGVEHSKKVSITREISDGTWKIPHIFYISTLFEAAYHEVQTTKSVNQSKIESSVDCIEVFFAKNITKVEKRPKTMFH